MKQKLLLTFALLLMAVSGAWADVTPQGEDEWDGGTNTLTLKSDPGNYYSNNTDIVNLVIEDGVTTIGDGAFQGCTSLMAVVIPDNVTNIGNSAFRDCTSLATVEIGSGVKTIGNGAFLGCTSLTTVDIPHGVTSIGDDAFSSCI